jgi:hypothetical protein
MRLNPNTKLVSLLAAIPSAAVVCDEFSILVPGNEDKSLAEICAETGITFPTFLEALENLDWEQEYPSNRG